MVVILFLKSTQLYIPSSPVTPFQETLVLEEPWKNRAAQVTQLSEKSSFWEHIRDKLE